MPTYGRFNLRLVRGKGTEVWDEEGKRYLDFGSGVAVSALGHSHPRMVAAITEQAQTLIHTSNLYYTRPQGELAARLVRYMGTPGKVFFCNSGAEANEGLYKLARKFGNEGVSREPRHHTGEVVVPERNRFTIITAYHSFHGRTLAGIAATGQEKVRKGFEPLTQGFIHVPYNDVPALQDAVQENEACAILLEPVQGESGVHIANPEYLRHARELCDDYGMLLMFDEVQCGLGRTGHWCGWHSIAPDVVPDAVSWAKGMGGGFPIGGFWASNRPVQMKEGHSLALSELLGAGSHGTTFGGTPLACAASNAVLQTIEEEGLLAHTLTVGAYAKQKIEALESPWITKVRGAGLMLAYELVPDFAQRVAGIPAGRAPSLHMCDLLQEAGLLNIPSGTHSVRWLPPLNVSCEEIDAAAGILRNVLHNLPVTSR